MFAIIVDQPGGVENLQWKSTETPTPRENEVLVRTVAAGVNRADILQRKGHYPPPKGITDIIGLEASGVVEAVGAEVTDWKPGDEVVALLAGGGYAEYFVAPAGQLIRPPAGVDLVDAAGLIEVGATVVSNMDLVRLSGSDRFLVHGGAGGIGAFAIQYAKSFGCEVFTTAGSTEKLEFCKSLGADHAIDYHEDWVSAIKELTDGAGIDVILDIMGAKYLEPNTRALALDGRIVVIGLQGGIKGELNLNLLLNRRGLITATSLRFRTVEQKAEICSRVAKTIWPKYSSGEIALPKLTKMSIGDVAKAHELLDSGDNIGKIVLTF